MSVELSVVTMLFRTGPWVAEFHRRMAAAAAAVSPSFEIVYVDDGSPDAAAEAVRAIRRSDPRAVLVSLSRNFGHHHAAMAGLAHARGRRVFIIDSDLEEQPEWLPRFAEEQARTGADVVFGVDAGRRGSAAGALFWKVFNLLSEVRVPRNPCTARLMTRAFVDALLKLPEKNLFLAGSYAWLGFAQAPVAVEKVRRAGRPSYTIGRRLSLGVDAVTSFSAYPLRVIFFSGVFIAFSAVLAGTYLALMKLADPKSVDPGWSSILVSIWFLSGLIIAILGVIGIYLSKIFLEAKNRPLYVVRGVEGGGPERAE